MPVPPSFTAGAIAGANSTGWTGRIGRNALKPRSYRISGTASDAARNRSTVKRVNVKIVKR